MAAGQIQEGEATGQIQKGEATGQIQKGETYQVAPVPLHRLLADLTCYELEVQTHSKLKAARPTKDVAVKLGPKQELLVWKDGAPGVTSENYLKRARGPSFFAHVPHVDAMAAAHLKVRGEGGSSVCAVYRQGAPAPPNTCFQYDRDIDTRAGKVPHFRLVPTADLLFTELAAVSNPTAQAQSDHNRWQTCMQALAEPATLIAPPWPDDLRIEQAVLLLELFSEDTKQPVDLRFEAVLYIYHLCDQHEYQDKDWNYFRVAADEQLMRILSVALQSAPQPDGIEQRLAFKWVEEDVDHYWQDISVS